MDYANLEEIITCVFCLETFNEDSRSPRMLQCGHSFCQTCLDKLLVRSPYCPTCNAEIQINFSETFPINFALNSLLSIRGQVGRPHQSVIHTEALASNDQRLNSRKHLSEEYCLEHDNIKETRCMDCNVWVCGLCASLRHNRCKTLLGVEAYTELKIQVSKKVENELGERKTIIEGLNKSLRVVVKETKSLIVKAKDCTKRFEELESQISDEVKLCSKLKQLQGIAERSTSVTEFSKTINELDKFLDEGKKQIPKHLQDFHLPQSRSALEILCQNEPVFVVEDRYDGTRYGKVAVKNGKIWVHHFQLEKPDAQLYVAFRKLLLQFSLTTELPKTTFIQLAPEGDEGNAVQIVIDTDGRSPRARNFVLLCSALRGSSYLKLPLVKYSYFPHFKEINPGPPPVLGGIRSDDFKIPVKKSGVYGMFDSSSWFRIQLKDNPFYSYKFGSVVSGLQNLQDLRADCSVTDCGLVI